MESKDSPEIPDMLEEDIRHHRPLSGREKERGWGVNIIKNHTFQYPEAERCLINMHVWKTEHVHLINKDAPGP